MRPSIGAALLLATIGCKSGDREIPFWQDGVLLDGDCLNPDDDPPVATGSLVSQLIDPRVDLSTYALTTGQVIRDEASYHDMMASLNLADYPLVDFSTQQVGAIFYDVDDSCELLIQGWNVLQGPNGAVLDVTFFDSALNCPQACGLDTQALLIATTDNDQSLGLCRRVVPGCEP